jgi:hypothetical protein
MPQSLGGPGPVFWTHLRYFPTDLPTGSSTYIIILHFVEASTSVHDLLLFISEVSPDKKGYGTIVAEASLART